MATPLGKQSSNALIPFVEIMGDFSWGEGYFSSPLKGSFSLFSFSYTVT